MDSVGIEIKRKVTDRLLKAKMRLLIRTPFYGSLVMHLKFALAKCGSAATNMRKIIFDPNFVNSISDEELDFVLMHEIMHCVLQHCIRGKGRNKYFFNVACDIVVNSNIMQTMGISEFSIAGNEAMHKAPDGKEGYLYSAEEVYDLLINKYEALIRDVDSVLEQIKGDYGVSFDEHGLWESIPMEDSLSDEWKEHLIEAAKKAKDNGVSSGIRKYLDELDKETHINWREVLHDFIKIINDRYDFSFAPPDRRFSADDIILPAFTQVQGDKVEKLWFLIDSSGSVSDEMLTDAFSEIKAAMNQFEYLSGKLSFFDTRVTEPVEFESVEDLKKIKPVGGGGTSFRNIFTYMRKNMEDELPVAVIILTDGYAAYPQESMAMGVPVLWIISNNDKGAPWGTSIIT